MEPGSHAQWTVDINGSKKITIPHGVSLLSGLAKNGILVPSACGGNARCGACKIKVVRGAGPVLPQEEALIGPEERTARYRLSCQVKVENDLSIEVPQHVFSIKQFTGRVIAKRTLTHDIAQVRIELIKPETIDFIAGQYVQIRSQPYLGKQAVVRAYSIASAPSDKTHIELMVRKVPDGICSGWVFDVLKEGDKAYFTAPYGDFRLSDSNVPAVFIAGGSGMGPLWSILQDMREKALRRPVRFFFGALTRRDLFLVSELTALQQELPDFAFVPALSNEPENSEWKGERGLITDVMARCMPDCSGCEAYLCGSPGMIGACINVLTKAGMIEKNIFYDKFI